MKQRTQRDALIIALLLEGWKLDEDAKSTRYLTFTNEAEAPVGRKLYVGKGAALRVGETVLSSIPVREGWREQLIEKGRSL